MTGLTDRNVGTGKPEGFLGVDLGIKDFAVTSDGEKIPNPHSLARRERNLARYQRRMAHILLRWGRNSGTVAAISPR